MEELLTFDDILLVPRYSDVSSRKDVNIASQIADIPLTLPIISANMDTITEVRMADAMFKAGGLGILHRYATPDKVYKWIDQLLVLIKNPHYIIPSVGYSPKSDFLKVIFDQGIRHVCMDVAHAHSKNGFDTVKQLKDAGFKVIAGNVATAEAAYYLMAAGADVIKVGIGPGSLCTTRLVTGHGIPQFSAIKEVANAVADKVSIIADGGIRYPGDVVKALHAGAHAVMIGGVISGTDETPGEVIQTPEGPYKVYRGMASEDAQISWRGEVSNGTAEGDSMMVKYKGSVKNILDGFAGGIRSGFSYSGASDIQSFKWISRSVRVTSNTLIENHPHARMNK